MKKIIKLDQYGNEERDENGVVQFVKNPMRTYNYKDGYTYAIKDGELVAFPSYWGGGYDKENMLYVSEFAYPLKKKQVIYITNKLRG